MGALKSDFFLQAFHQRYVVEISGHAVGLVVQERGGFRFFASAVEVSPLNRLLFVSPRRAEDACRGLLNVGRRPGSVERYEAVSPDITQAAGRVLSSMIGG